MPVLWQVNKHLLPFGKYLHEVWPYSPVRTFASSVDYFQPSLPVNRFFQTFYISSNQLTSNATNCWVCL